MLFTSPSTARAHPAIQKPDFKSYLDLIPCNPRSDSSTGAKAVVNQSGKALGGLVSAGRWEPGNLIAVNPQTDIGYDSAALPARIGAEAIVAAETMMIR